MILSIRSRNYSLKDIVSIGYESGNLLIFMRGCTGEYGEFSHGDPDGKLYDVAMTNWREFLQNQSDNLRASIEYATQLAFERVR